jgi:hypothetical protein
MLCIYEAIGRAVSWKLHLILFFSSRIVPIIVFFTNAIKFGTSIYFPCIVIAPGVIGIVGDGMEHASCLLLERVNLILELRALQDDIPFLIRCWMGPDLPHQRLKR